MSVESIGQPFVGSAGRLTSRKGPLARFLRRWVRLRYLDRIERNVTAGSELLEFGCGGGDAWLAATYRVTGLEIAESAASAARKLYPEVLVANVRAIPVADSRFDAAASIFVLEHLPFDAATDTLRELHRVLRPGGKLVCMCDLECDHPLLKWAREHYPEGYREAYVEAPGHYGLRREDAQRSLVEDAGFEVREWRLQSRFPILDHCPWGQLSLSVHFTAWARTLGRFAFWLASLPRVGALWALAVTLLDAFTKFLWPKSWAYRLAFVVEKIATRAS